MKVELTFDLGIPGDEYNFKACINAPDVLAALREYERWLKRVGEDEVGGINECTEGHINAREQLFKIFQDHGVSAWGDQ